MDLVSISIGIGLLVSLAFSEWFGLAAGGMVVPGYMALFLNDPSSLVFTILAAVATYLVVRLISRHVIVYGKRRTALMILVGFLFGFAIREATVLTYQHFEVLEPLQASSFTVIGFIIPGLIAIWFDRQGVVETLSVLCLASVVVRLILIIGGMELLA